MISRNAPDNPAVNPQDIKANIGGKRPARFLLALPEDLRAAIKRAAYIAGRTETAEINIRLAASFRASTPPQSHPAPLTTYPTQPVQALTTDDLPKESNGDTLNDHDRAVLALFRQLPPEKQLSLLTLLR